jgi:membrane peptidoglycan carboxypeptidase
MVYGGITSGSTWRFPGRVASLDGVKDVAPPAASTLLIAEIRDVDDRVLYRGAPERTVVTSVAAGAMTTDILEHVVTSGTGRRASGAVSLGGAELPLAGKTGTTNSFRNAAFLGTAPVIDGPGLRTGRSMVVGVYVGYDDNRSMVSGRIKLAGASGALPAWVQTVRGLSGAELLGKASLSAPEDGWVRDVPAGLELMAVDPATGLLAEAATESTVSVLARDRAPVLAVASPVDEHGAARRTRIAPRTLDVDAYLEDRLKQAGGRKGLWPKLKKRRKPRPAE